MTDYVTVVFFWIFSVYTTRARRWLGPQRVSVDSKRCCLFCGGDCPMINQNTRRSVSLRFATAKKSDDSTKHNLCNHFVLDFFFSPRERRRSFFPPKCNHNTLGESPFDGFPRTAGNSISRTFRPKITGFFADYITTSTYIFGIKMIIQFFMNENVYIRILCHSQKYFSLSRFISTFDSCFLRFSCFFWLLIRRPMRTRRGLFKLFTT